MKKLVLLFSVVALLSTISCTTNSKDSAPNPSNKVKPDTCTIYNDLDSVATDSTAKEETKVQNNDSTKVDSTETEKNQSK